MLFTEEILSNLRVPHVHPSQVAKMNAEVDRASKSPSSKKGGSGDKNDEHSFNAIKSQLKAI